MSTIHLPHLRLDPGRLIGTGVRVSLIGVIVVLVGLSAVIIFGFVSSGGSQPGQLLPQPSASLALMPMGNAHIPTTNACVLCHGSGGEVKAPVPILHPIEGWRRCLTCHTNEALGRSAPGHENIAETECLNCHKTGQTGPAITQPHAALHDQHCLDCHGTVAHLPTTMASSQESACILCHKPATLPPPSYPHAANAILSCRACHQSAEVGALPIDHALRSDSTCLLCHEITVISDSGKPGTVGPGASAGASSAAPSAGFTFPLVSPAP
ncbi:MAG: hypothetical protein HY263_07130 [Chloroflexi bacterium]|nr:hypothetical protein [Chloroflexota bacterium]